MPELPELQAHAERLTKGWGGNVLRKFTPLSFTAMKTAVPPPSEALDHALEGVGRRGKYLLLDFGALTFAVHLMQGGRLKPDPKQAAKVKGGVARWVFDDRSALMLTEAGHERRAGVWTDPEVATAGLGPEADQVTPEELAKLFASTRCGCTSSSVIRMHHGLGCRLANEITIAKVSPFAPTTKPSARRRRRRHVILVSTSPRLRARLRRQARQPTVPRTAGPACPACGDTVPGLIPGTR
jgi:formamidopyrimidine-DNA glycosylase